jgi:signal transduction histidine kinase
LLAEVAEDSARAGTVVQKMAGFLRRDPPVRRLLNLNSVVTATIDLFRSEAAAQAVEIQADLAEPPAWVEGDPIQLQQALLNLAANAMDALRPITGRLRVIRFLTSTAAGKSRITVQDTGSGFLPEQEARAFEPFYTTRQDGLGIGLPLARRIVEDHGGELLADSLPGWGAAFHLEFPAATPAGSPIASPSR